ncbi:MAG TPA: hypothetical protein PKL77_05075 [Candidatus Omnitrophota bacterium]|nr:hypothetical protein [Candidatus Omnitrophota bacterium]
MNAKTEIIQLLFIWAVVLFFLVKDCLKERGARSGLTLLVIMNYSLNYFFGALAYLSPNYPSGAEEIVIKGLRVAVLAFVSFFVGGKILIKLFSSFVITVKEEPAVVKRDLKRERNLVYSYLGVGFLISFFLKPFFATVSTVSTLMSFGMNLIVVGTCLGVWQAFCENKHTLLKRWYLFVCSFPVLSIIFMGFLGIGVGMFLSVNAFLFRFFKLKLSTAVAILLISYGALSFYQTYMMERDNIRLVVWGESSVVNKVKVFQTSFSKVEFFDPLNTDHLMRITGRIDANYMAGLVVNYMESGYIGHAGFESITTGLASLVPRFLWPNKPIFAGGSGLASKYTGLTFSEDTSVGLGFPSQLFVAFDYFGVVVGFCFFGFLVVWVDIMAGYYVGRTNYRKFLQWFLPGLVMISVDTFTDLFSGTTAAVIFAYIVSKII